MPQLWSNNAKGALSAGISAAATSLTLGAGQGAAFPTVTSPNDYIIATLEDAADPTRVEVVCVTAHAGGSDTFTIVRAYEKVANAGPTALAFVTGDLFAIRATAGAFDSRTEIPLAVKTVDPVTIANRAMLFSRRWGGRALPSWDPATGNPTKLQTNIYGNQILLVKPNTGTTALPMIGGAKTEGGTLSHPALATTNFLTKQRRAQWTNVVTTANQFLGMRVTDLQCARLAAAGEGGFFFFARFGFPLFPAATRVFVGLASLTTGVQVTANPSAAAEDHIGLAIDSADTNLTIMCKDGTTNTKNAIGAGLPRNANETYDLYIFAKQNASDIGVRLDRWTSAGVNSNLLDTTYTTNIPRTTIFLAPVIAMSNVAITGVGTVTIALMSMYLETDN